MKLADGKAIIWVGDDYLIMIICLMEFNIFLMRMERSLTFLHYDICETSSPDHPKGYLKVW